MKDKILLIDKPAGWTSFDVVAKVRSELRKQMSNEQLAKDDALAMSDDSMGPHRQSSIANVSHIAHGILPMKKKIKVGHAGTLDPFATGLLIVLVGKATKRADEFLKLDKTYEFTAKLGEVSTTGDTEGEITVNGDDTPSKNAVLAALEKFTGEITQIPPSYSAIKIDGKRAYKLAREGKKVEIPPRQVTVSRLQVAEYDYPYLKCVCDVSSGTYIRTLVEDIGKSLNTGAYCLELRRTRIGDHQIADAQSIDKLT